MQVWKSLGKWRGGGMQVDTGEIIQICEKECQAVNRFIVYLVDDPSLRNTGFFIMDIWDIFVELQSWSTMKTLKK